MDIVENYHDTPATEIKDKALTSPKRHGTYLFLAIFFGWIGLHDFFLGKDKAAYKKVYLSILIFTLSMLTTYIPDKSIAYICHVASLFCIVLVEGLITFDLFKTVNYDWATGYRKPIISRLLGVILIITTIVLCIGLFATVSGISIPEEISSKKSSSERYFNSYFENSCNKKHPQQDEKSRRFCKCAAELTSVKLGEDNVELIVNDLKAKTTSKNIELVRSISPESFAACKLIVE